MKILVCTDNSKHSMKALKMAARLAECCKDKVETIDIVHVYHVDLPVSDFHSTVTYIEQYEFLHKFKKEEGEKILEAAAQVFTGVDAEVNTILKEGHPAATIIKMAATGNYDLIIMGSRGLGGLKKALLGSVSNAVLQEVQTSVLIVK
ncbi:MAG: universal stress protein [Firmicutes bacterium]|nr:universal stress protein [Bacillota bacterium]